MKRIVLFVLLIAMNSDLYSQSRSWEYKHSENPLRRTVSDEFLLQGSYVSGPERKAQLGPHLGIVCNGGSPGTLVIDPGAVLNSNTKGEVIIEVRWDDQPSAIQFMGSRSSDLKSVLFPNPLLVFSGNKPFSRDKLIKTLYVG